MVKVISNERSGRILPLKSGKSVHAEHGVAVEVSDADWAALAKRQSIGSLVTSGLLVVEGAKPEKAEKPSKSDEAAKAKAEAEAKAKADAEAAAKAGKAA